MRTKTPYSTTQTRIKAVAALNRGMSISEVSTAFQAHRTTVYRWKKRSLAPNGLLRKNGSGRPSVLCKVDAYRLKSFVLRPAKRFGFENDLWTCLRLRKLIQSKFQTRVSKWTVWRKLRQMNLTYQKPERKYLEMSEKDRDEWKSHVIPQIKKTVRKHKALLYFQDESNISLTAAVGKTWAPCGQTPKIVVSGKRCGVAAMSAISGVGSLIFRLHEKRIKTFEVIEFLNQMLLHHPRRHLVVVMDQAPPHKSKKTKEFIASQKRLHVFYLPKYSPDWNPDEKVWNHLKNHELKAHGATNRKELRKLTGAKLRKMASSPDVLRGLFFRCCVADFLH